MTDPKEMKLLRQEMKEKERKEMLKKAGYFTVNDLLQKLQQLKEQGYGDELIGSDFEHYQYCEYDSNEKYVVIC